MIDDLNCSCDIPSEFDIQMQCFTRIGRLADRKTFLKIKRDRRTVKKKHSGHLQPPRAADTNCHPLLIRAGSFEQASRDC